MKRLRILADTNICELAPAVAAFADVTLREGREIRRQDLMATDALLVRSVTQVDEELLEGTPVKFVATATSGFDHIDRSYLQSRGIGFAHSPGSNANSVVEYVLTAIAAVDDHLDTLLSGGRVGIVGYGHIGKLLNQRLKALGIDTIVYDPWLDASEVDNRAELAQVLACQVVSLHCSLGTEQPWPSKHLLNTDALSLLPSTSLLINASRGPVVDNLALQQRMLRDEAPTVVLDVWEWEPEVKDELLVSVRLGTAHIAGYSYDSKLNATAMLVNGVTQHFALPPADIRAGAGKEGSALVLPESDASGAAFLRNILLAQYDIKRDDATLRAMIQHAAGDKALADAGFDRLRKTYPVRRELAGHPVKGTYTQEQRDWLLALGCVPIEDKPA
ncbi:MAG: 4-phosphoerythronate dehydrogenase [Halioglobus sp.]